MIPFRQNYTSLPYTYQCQEQTQKLRNGDCSLKRPGTQSCLQDRSCKAGAHRLLLACRKPGMQGPVQYTTRLGTGNNTTWDKTEVQRPVQDETAQIVNKETQGQKVQLRECSRSFIYRSFTQQELNLHYCKTQVYKFFYMGEFFMTLKFYMALNTNKWISVSRRKIWS